MKVEIKKSDRKGKKLKATFYDEDENKIIKTVHFGAKGYSDYTKHKDSKRREKYLARHRKGQNEDWNEPTTAGALSRWILWEHPELETAIEKFKKKFDLVSKNKKYVPKSLLSPEERVRQTVSIVAGERRPKVKNYEEKDSKWTKKARKFFGRDRTLKKIAEKIDVEEKGLQKIIEKGRGAYYSSGSRPNQTPDSWGKARLYSVLFGGPAREVDAHLVDKYDIPLLVA